MVRSNMGIEIRDGHIRCHDNAFKGYLKTGNWKPESSPDGTEAWRGELYTDLDAGPGQVRALVADIGLAQGAWQMRLHGIVIDNDGNLHAGTLGKHYANLKSVSSAKMRSTRGANEFARGNAVLFSPDAVDGAWQPGDWVLDAVGRVWVRASDNEAAAGKTWGSPPTAAWCQRGDRLIVTVPKGHTADDVPARPLALLIRNGTSVGR